MLLVGILMGGMLIGQDKDPPKAKGMLPANWKKLGLTDQQKETVYRTQTRYRDLIAPHEAKIKELRKEEKAELDKILTAAQKERLKEILLGEPKDPEKDPDKDK